jgi:hypothetical protein
VKIALAKAIKTDVSRSGFITFEEMAKRGLGTIASEIPGTFLIKSWFRNRSFNKIFQPLSIGKGYTINLLIQTSASTKDTQNGIQRRKWFQ